MTTSNGFPTSAMFRGFSAGSPRSLTMDNGATRLLTPEQVELVELALSDSDVFTPREAAQLLGVSRPMVSRWLRDGVLPDTPVGTHHKIPRNAVLALKAQRMARSAEASQLLDAAKTDSAAARQTAVSRAAALAQVAERDA